MFTSPLAMSWAVMCFVLLVYSVPEVDSANGEYLRRLVGSNCIEVETGVVPRYFSCLGCVIEQATGCVNDMRYNKSKNVDPHCPLFAHTEQYKGVCCPQIREQFRLNKRGSPVSKGVNLFYVGSAYPNTLRCIQKAGCGGSVIYKQLQDECLAVCNGTDPRSGGSVCYSDFNAAPSTALPPTALSLSAVIGVISMLLLSV